MPLDELHLENLMTVLEGLDRRGVFEPDELIALAPAALFADPADQPFDLLDGEVASGGKRSGDGYYCFFHKVLGL